MIVWIRSGLLDLHSLVPERFFTCDLQVNVPKGVPFNAGKKGVSNGPLSLLTLIESNFDSNLCTLSRGVFPTVKYSGLIFKISLSSWIYSDKNRQE